MLSRFIFTLLIIAITLINAAQPMAISLIRDEEVEFALLELARPIFKAARLDPRNVGINIIHQDDPNAFVINGNEIFISTGLLKFSDNPEAVAGVMCHEVGHIVGGHVIQRNEAMNQMSGKMLLTLLAGVAAGVASQSSDVGAGVGLGLYSEAVGNLMSFNRSQESAADSAGVRYMKAIGVESNGLLEFLQTLNTVDRTFYSEVSNYQRTHPVTQSRIEFIKSQSIHPQESYITPKMRDDFKFASAKIDGFTSSPSDVLRRYSDDNSDAARYAKSIALFRSNQKTESLKEIDYLISAYPKSANFYELKGQILFESGSVAESIPCYAKSHELNKNSDIIKIEYANVLIYAKQQVQKAITMLKQVVSKDRNDPMAWNLLAKAYDLNHDDINKHIALAYTSYLTGDDVTARKHVNAIKKEKAAQSSKDLKDLEQIMKSNPVKHDE